MVELQGLVRGISCSPSLLFHLLLPQKPVPFSCSLPSFPPSSQTTFICFWLLYHPSPCQPLPGKILWGFRHGAPQPFVQGWLLTQICGSGCWPHCRVRNMQGLWEGTSFFPASPLCTIYSFFFSCNPPNLRCPLLLSPSHSPTNLPLIDLPSSAISIFT